MRRLELAEIALLLDLADDVAIARTDLPAGLVAWGPNGPIETQAPVPRGHKFALHPMDQGEAVRKYGAVIGWARRPIRAGDHVHTDNLGLGWGGGGRSRGTKPAGAGTRRPILERNVVKNPAPGSPTEGSGTPTSRNTAGGVDGGLRTPAAHRRPGTLDGGAPALPQPPERQDFMGYRRADGSVGTRNYIGILTSVNCAASTARMIAEHFRPMAGGWSNSHRSGAIGAIPSGPGDAHSALRGVDGVVPIVHSTGCGLTGMGLGTQVLRRTLQGYARHPNFGGLLILGLGCEMLSLDLLADGLDLPSDKLVERLTIQSCGGVRATVDEGIAIIRAMASAVGAARREPCLAADLILALNCGGSDSYSGITANPSLGVASDLIVAAGGRSVLAETPEIYGAEDLLMARATDPGLGEWLRQKLAWWREYVGAAGGSLDNNPSPGNKAGGLTTILEKSLGATAKSGHAPLCAVYEYAEKIDRPGLGFMDTPGYDPVSVTGLVAGGANIVAFTTGRGSVFGCRPVPCLKLSSNSELAARQGDDIDIDCGGIADGRESVDDAGHRIYDRLLDIAGGVTTVNEDLAIGVDEFVPWHLGAVT